MALTVNLPPHLRDYIAREVAAGRFADEEAAVIDAIELVVGMETDDPELTASIAQADRGEFQSLTPDLWNEIRETAKRHSREGHVVRHDIRY